MRKWLILSVMVTVIAAVAIWWDNGGQHWAAYQTGTYCGSTGVHYCYWSGFGSVWPWNLLAFGPLFGILLVQWRHVNCHVKGCPLIGRYQLAGGEYKVCGKHNLGFQGKHPSLAHMWERHLQHKGKEAGNV